MSETLYQLQQRLFDETGQIPSGPEREAFITAACRDDPSLETAIRELLAADTAAASFFADGSETLVRLLGAAPVGDLAAGASPVIGSAIGPYQILELIGEGGCGAVFVAEQQRPIRRRVALKIIRLGMDTAAVIARFEAERQALALMDHPNIAHVIDAGATDTGLPYFVMELVHGASITRYCDENELSIAVRLGLFAQVCQAIQHAHQKGVIHRDIKPSNILITCLDGLPVPKVIDFGIAKATDLSLADNASLTHKTQMIGTPAYMSPEQAERGGLEIDTRSDIYSLGVLLYEMLAGQPPFDPTELARGGMTQLLRTLREIEPPLPSQVLASLAPESLAAIARRRGSEPSGLLAAVRGDLDWIVSKAMDKDRSRRYETAHGFAADIVRHLDHEPVIACPPSRRYRLRKLIRRNRTVFASAAAMAAMLLIATGVSTRLYLREREARQRLTLAEQQQGVLRQEAERGHEQEAELRLLSEAREKVTQAVVLLRDGNFPAADALVAGVPLIRPTPEGAEVFRRLGDWHAVNGRWREAVERSSYLIQVNYLDGADIPALDHLRTGAAWIESGDVAGYESFRRAMIARFAGTPGVISAERTVKVALLMPAAEDLMRDLNPLIDVASASLLDVGHPHSSNAADIESWRTSSVALGEYRRGRFEQADIWARTCLGSASTSGSRNAAARILLALALHQRGRFAEARTELAQASATVKEKFREDLPIFAEADGWWFDWIIARILLREAQALISGGAATDVAR
jgi:serine/threonine protein kinase